MSQPEEHQVFQGNPPDENFFMYRTLATYTRWPTPWADDNFIYAALERRIA